MGNKKTNTNPKQQHIMGMLDQGSMQQKNMLTNIMELP
jgi:hypothetical protein